MTYLINIIYLLFYILFQNTIQVSPIITNAQRSNLYPSQPIGNQRTIFIQEQQPFVSPSIPSSIIRTIFSKVRMLFSYKKFQKKKIALFFLNL